MTTLFSAAAQTCLTLELGSGTDLLFSAVILVIPAVAIPVIARTARRHPSRLLQSQGRRRGGVQVTRAGWVVTTLSLIAMLVVLLAPTTGDLDCTGPAGYTTVFALIGVFVGALLIGGGWAFAIRATWVILATLAVLDLLILYINVLISFDGVESAGGLLLLAFALHGLCTSVAARWSFTAKDLGPVERAKAGEAGRTLGAVWVFLAAYSVFNLVRAGDGVFETAAGSAVLGALTLGALAVTMGSGYTKYAEAMNSRRRADVADEPPPEPAD